MSARGPGRLGGGQIARLDGHVQRRAAADAGRRPVCANRCDLPRTGAARSSASALDRHARLQQHLNDLRSATRDAARCSSVHDDTSYFGTHAPACKSSFTTPGGYIRPRPPVAMRPCPANPPWPLWPRARRRPFRNRTWRHNGEASGLGHRVEVRAPLINNSATSPRRSTIAVCSGVGSSFRSQRAFRCVRGPRATRRCRGSGRGAAAFPRQSPWRTRPRRPRPARRQSPAWPRGSAENRPETSRLSKSGVFTASPCSSSSFTRAGSPSRPR